MNLLISYGTRPEYIKVKPLLGELDKLNIEYKVLFTGQHADLVPTDIATLRLPGIACKGNRLDTIVSSILEHKFIYEGTTHVLVQGDTTSAFAVALGAFHREIPVIHLEAGLRTYKHDPYPEEFNRTSISKMASIHLAPTAENKKNLMMEGTPEGHIHVVGNTVLDDIPNIDVEYDTNVIVTLHRRENLHKLPDYFEQLNAIAMSNKNLTFKFPMHPNPAIQELKHLVKAPNIKIVQPIPYHEFMVDLAKCRFIISDSGGLQEEASFYNKRIIVCRESTERPEIIGTFGILCGNPEDLPMYFKAVNDNYKINELTPYGDGAASERIAQIIKKL